LREIGLEDLCEDNFRRMGGVQGQVSSAHYTVIVPISILMVSAERRVSQRRRACRHSL
jgi:hypothetical protein